MHNRLLGTVKWFNEDHGMGVISSDEEEVDYFVTQLAIIEGGQGSLQEGERVSFEPVIEGVACWAFNVIREQP
ncbi:hypothetical protein C4Q28_02665 [Pseudomonas sp. SWI6]|uniref:Cold shock domain-containing protein n=1 Tax=Pseudomonas taiwanensis TaxID=470150 RepID=A0ABR6VAG4_9PSED|nr:MULTISPECIES: cold shock domain-containing protein [Pseudomonas]AVD81138.1 hypothetical protein C4Q28_02665 [Pseudomonas sp. SWI6]MBC3477145.1 cold shock domain-containing protein [Pseudomonas taiwanensis]MBC3489959.1 cold shock domain-containing protein [Pseudomonas taiwanensis]